MGQVRLAELSAATSLFTDMGTGQPAEHGLRTCLIAMRLAEVLGLETNARSEVFHVSLLRLLGCTADADQVAALAGGDEIQFFAGMAPVTMGSPRTELARMVRLIAAGRPVPQRLRTLARALTDPAGRQRLLDAHCEVGARLAAEMGLPAGVGDALRAAYARWDGRGVPAGVGGADIPVSVRVSIVARDVAAWERHTGADAARQILLERRGRAYDPDTVDAALEIGVPDLVRCADDLWAVVLDLEPPPRVRVSGTRLLRALQALGDFADLKLPERRGHARRVTRIASAAGAIAGLHTDDGQTLTHAALVHDLGVVAIPVDIWRAGSRPGSAESEQIRLHPHWSSRALVRCAGLEPVATAVRQHHERVDGSGYPSGTTGDPGRVSSLLACAVLFDELTAVPGADRPPQEAATVMAELAGGGALNRHDVNAVLAGVSVAAPAVHLERPAGLTEREIEVLGLLSRGGTNRQIAAALGVSAKTVGAHVEHIYAKIGVRSRAAATLFAMQHDLLG